MADAVYWIGQDGNVYFGNGIPGSGVTNYGSASSYTPTAQGLTATNPSGNKMAQSVADGAGIILGKQIADPNAPVASAPAAGTPVAPGPVFNQAGADNTQKTIDQIPGLLQAALDAENTTYGNTTGALDASKTAQQGQYDESTTTNQQNYDSNFMDSIRAGIKGLGGLMSLLRGTGAAGGTAEDLARDTVGGTTADDIRTGADTQKTNQTTLDDSLSAFLTDLGTKRKAADDTHVNNDRAIQRDSSTQLQDLYSKMAGFYGDVGNTNDSNSWMNKAGALTPDIAANSKTQVSPYDTTPIVVHAPNLTSFTDPTQPSVVAPPSDGQVGSGIFTLAPPSNSKKVAPTPALAGA